MSSYNIEYFLSEFAQRTIENLKWIEDSANKNGKVFEVTGLINSLLGLIIIPVEKYKNTYQIRDRDIRLASPGDYFDIVNLIKKCDDEKRFFSDYEGDRDEYKRIYVSNFINHIRNAIAHGGNNGLHFYPISGNGDITHIIFYDNNEVQVKRQNDRKKDINEFCIRLSVSELKDLTKAISRLYCQFEKRDENMSEKQNKYDSDIKKLRNLLENGRQQEKTKVIFELENSEIS